MLLTLRRKGPGRSCGHSTQLSVFPGSGRQTQGDRAVETSMPLLVEPDPHVLPPLSHSSAPIHKIDERSGDAIGRIEQINPRTVVPAAFSHNRLLTRINREVSVHIETHKHPKGEKRREFAQPLKANTVAILVNSPDHSSKRRWKPVWL